MSVLRRIFAIKAAHGGWLLPWPGEVGQLADLVGFHLGPLAAPFAFAPQEPGDQLLAANGRGGQAVVDDRLALPFERDAAEPCDQRFPARPLLAGLVTGTRPVLGGDGGLVLAGHLRHRRAVLAGQGLQHRHLSRAVQPVQFMNVPGEQVVLDEPPVLRAVGADDLEVIQVQQAGPVPRCAVDQVRGLPGRDHLPGHAQPDHAVDGGPGHAVLGDDVVTEEPSPLGTGVGDQRLIRRQFQLELVAQEPGETLLDFLGLSLRTGEPEEMVVGVPGVPEPAVAGVTRIPVRQAAPLLAQLPGRGPVPALASGSHRVVHLSSRRIGYPAGAPGIFRDENCLSELVQPVQVNVRQDRGNDTALRSTGKRRVPYPVLQVPGPEHSLDQTQEPVIVNVLRQYGEHDRMVKRAKAVRDITLDKPGCPFPGFRHFRQRGVATPSGTETVGPSGKPRLVVRFQQDAHHLADQFTGP